MEITVNKDDKSEVELSVEIPSEKFEEYRSKAIAEAGKDVEVQGFRKGNVPENVLEQKLGEESIQGHMAEMAVNDLYPQALKEKGIDAIGKPDVKITKIGKGSPFGFTVSVAKMPETTLPDYNALAKEVFSETSDVEVTNEDIENTITEIRQRYAASAPQTGEDTEGGEAQSQAGSDAQSDEEKEHEHQMPELTDEFVQSLGDFKDVEDFKQKIADGIRQEKQKKEEDNKRMNLIEKIIEQADITVPDVLIQGELDRMMSQFEGQIAQAGGSLDDYLSQTGKSREDMRSDWRGDAEKRVKAQLVLNKIATEEDIHADKEQVDQELERMKQQYGEEVDADRLRGYIEMVLTNEAVFNFLKKSSGSESQSEETNE